MWIIENPIYNLEEFFYQVTLTFKYLGMFNKPTSYLI